MLLLSSILPLLPLLCIAPTPTHLLFLYLWPLLGLLLLVLLLPILLDLAVSLPLRQASPLWAARFLQLLSLQLFDLPRLRRLPLLHLLPRLLLLFLLLSLLPSLWIFHISCSASHCSGLGCGACGYGF